MGQNIDDDVRAFIKEFCGDTEKGFKRMVPFRQRCEEYSTTKYPRITNIKTYKPGPKEYPFKDIEREEFDKLVRDLSDLNELRDLYDRIQPAIEGGFGGLNAVLIVGGTGAGKSTMINSILYGPNILEKDGKKIVFKEEFAKK